MNWPRRRQLTRVGTGQVEVELRQLGVGLELLELGLGEMEMEGPAKSEPQLLCLQWEVYSRPMIVE